MKNRTNIKAGYAVSKTSKLQSRGMMSTSPLAMIDTPPKPVPA